MPKGNIVIILIITATLIVSTAAKVRHDTDRSALKKRVPNIPFAPPKPYVARFDWQQLEYLKAHNALRREVSLLPLVWDPNLAASAHDWAAQRRGDCNYRLHSSNNYGENIYWMEYKEFTPADVVQKWFDEYKFYDHVRNVCLCDPERAGCECGHYLNVIWKTTERVGCSGAVYCDNQKGVLVVCQYDPAGLIPGINPFTGLSYGRIANITKHTAKTDIINLLDGSDLNPHNLKVEYTRNYSPLSMMVEFSSRSAYDAGLRAIGRKGRLFSLSRADRAQWDTIAPFDGKAILMQGIPRNALIDDVERFLSGCHYDSSSTQIFVRQTNEGLVRMALVRFPSQVLATHAYITKNGGFCLNNKISLQLLH